MSTIPITEACNSLDSLARTVATTREPIYLTDHGRPIAAIVHPDAILELQEALAYKRVMRKKLDGTLVTHSIAEVRAMIGIPVPQVDRAS